MNTKPLETKPTKVVANDRKRTPPPYFDPLPAEAEMLNDVVKELEEKDQQRQE